MKRSSALLRLVFPGILLCLTVISCQKFEEYPDEPYIEFREFGLIVNPQTGISEKGILRIFYRDGDGDIGLEQGDTLFPFQEDGDYYYNLLITYYEQQNGVFTEVPLVSWNNITQQYDTLTFNARMPLLLPKDQKKSIKGIIDNEMFIYNPLSAYDTIQFRVKITDRALNVSNEVVTPPIVLIKP
ncbi:MAG: hypothetical protein Q8S18_02775 [Bacteroidales bacterium]|nr:hypothetical protein [Bacteroidales bacterium]